MRGKGLRTVVTVVESWQRCVAAPGLNRVEPLRSTVLRGRLVASGYYEQQHADYDATREPLMVTYKMREARWLRHKRRSWMTTRASA